MITAHLVCHYQDAVFHRTAHVHEGIYQPELVLWARSSQDIGPGIIGPSRWSRAKGTG